MSALMKTSNFPGGFAQGLTVRGLPLAVAHPGNIYFVDSGGSPGKGTFDRPFATTAAALAHCVAGRGDILLYKPGHSETITAAAGIALSVAGVAMLGLGTGSLRPTFNFTTAVGADIDIDAANITIANFLFTGGIDALTGPIDINAADCTLIGIETRDVTGQATDFIVTDANADRLHIQDWTHRGAVAAGADTAISIVGGDDITIDGAWIDGNFAVAAIENVTTAAANLKVFGGSRPSFLRTRNSADVLFTAVATTTGDVGPNIYGRLADDAANITEAFVGADMQFHQPISIANADGEVGMNTNIAASTDA